MVQADRRQSARIIASGTIGFNVTLRIGYCPLLLGWRLVVHFPLAHNRPMLPEQRRPDSRSLATDLESIRRPQRVCVSGSTSARPMITKPSSSQCDRGE